MPYSIGAIGRVLNYLSQDHMWLQQTTELFNAWTVRRQTCCYLPSRRESQPTDQWQITRNHARVYSRKL